MKKNKEEKKARKEEKQTRALVKEAFLPNGKKKETNPLVENLVKSVLLNKAVLKKEKKAKKLWQDEYYRNLFAEFTKLVKRHNEIYEIKLDEISNKVEGKKRELKVLKAEIKKAEAEKELLSR